MLPVRVPRLPQAPGTRLLQHDIWFLEARLPGPCSFPVTAYGSVSCRMLARLPMVSTNSLHDVFRLAYHIYGFLLVPAGVNVAKGLLGGYP